MSSKNGAKTAEKRTDGRFAAGNAGGPGRPPSTNAPRRDGWQSTLTGIGTARDKSIAAQFCVDEVTAPYAQDLWRGDDLAARIIEKVPAECFRKGYTIDVSDDSADKAKEMQEQIEGKLRDLGYSKALRTAREYENAYGGGVVLLGVNDGQTMDKPLNIDKVSKFDWVTTAEPREIQPYEYYGDPMAPKFGEPELYIFTPQSPGYARDMFVGSQSIHESRLIVFRGIRVSRMQVSSQPGFGDSKMTRVLRVLRQFNMSFASAGALIEDFAQAIFKMKGLAEAFDSDKGSLITDRMKALDMGRSVVHAMLIDEEEEFSRITTNVTGLPDLLDRFLQRLAMAADMPVSKLGGESPGGLNSSGAESEQDKEWNDQIAAEQENDLTEPVKTGARCAMRALGIKEPAKWGVCWRPLSQQSEKEAADTRYVQAQTDQIEITAQIITPEEARQSRHGGDVWSPRTVINDEPATITPDDTAAAYATGDLDANAPKVPGTDDTGAAKSSPNPEGANDPQTTPGDMPAAKPTPDAPTAKPGDAKPAAPGTPGTPGTPGDAKPAAPGTPGTPGHALKMATPPPAPPAAPARPGFPAPAAPAPTQGADVAKTAMSGVQVTSLIEVVTSSVSGLISRESAKAILMLAFPVDDGTAESVLGPENFEPTKPPAPPSPFGGGAPGAPGKPPAFGKPPASTPPTPPGKAPTIPPVPGTLNDLKPDDKGDA